MKHGTLTGYGHHGCRCEACREAKVTHQKWYRRSRVKDRGLISAQPYKGMLEELLSLGYSRAQLSRALGYKGEKLTALYCERITRRNAKMITNLHWFVWRHSGPLRIACRHEVPEEIVREVYREAI